MSSAHASLIPQLRALDALPDSALPQATRQLTVEALQLFIDGLRLPISARERSEAA